MTSVVIRSPVLIFMMLSSRIFLSAFKAFTPKVSQSPSFGHRALRMMATEVFIGNLPVSFNEDSLKDLVNEKVGESYSKIRLVLDRETGRSRGFGYLTFEEESSAATAVSSLAGTAVDGRVLKVDIAQPPRKDRSAGDGGERPKRAGTDPQTSCYIGNLDFKVTSEDIMAFCDEQLGPGIAKDVRLAIDRETGRSKGFAHIEFNSPEQVTQAVETLSGKELSGRPLRVDVAQQRDGAPRDRASSPRESFSPRGQRSDSHSVFIGNLAWTVDDSLIREMVTEIVGANTFTNIRIALDRDTGRSKGFGHIDFVDAETASRAVELLNALEVEGRQIRADHAQRGTPGGERRGGFSKPSGGDRYGEKSNSNSNSGFESW